MGFLTRLIREARSSEIIASLRNPPAELVNIFGGIETAAGAKVTQQSSLGVTAVYSCVKLIAWSVASLPLVVYERLVPRGKTRASGHPIYNLLHDAPNPEQTSFEWRALTSVHQNLWGAGISEIEFDANGRPVALWPIPPWYVKPMRTENKKLVYEISKDGQTQRLWPYQVLVFPALSTSRDSWLSPIGVHRETIGMALALGEFGAKTFGQGTNPAGIITHPTHLKDNSEEALKKKFAPYSGLGSSHRLMYLEDGMKFDRVGLPPEDAQYIETRKFTISDIARIFSVPLHLLQDHEKSTSWGTGIEEMNLGFVMFTLRPYLVQWEQEIKRRLIFDDRYFAEFLIDGLLRGKLQSRYASYATGRQWGWLSADDIREIENMNPLPDGQGEIYLQPSNMIDPSKPTPAAINTEPAPAAADGN